MMRVFTIGLFSLFSIMVAGTAMAQERQVLQEGYTGGGTGRIGSGPGGGLDNGWMRDLLAKPETIYGRIWGIDIPGGKIYLETGGGALVTVRLSEKTNMDSLKLIRTGTDVEVQAYRKTRIMGQGAFASEVPEGDPYVISMAVLREAPLSNNAGNNPDTDRAIIEFDFNDHSSKRVDAPTGALGLIFFIHRHWIGNR